MANITPPKKGDRVRLKSVNIKGTIFYVDNRHLFVDHFYPIQVELDKPYDENGQTMYRTNLPDIVRLKKKKPTEEKPKKAKAIKKKKKAKSFDDEEFIF